MFWYWFGFSGFLVLIISGFFGLKMFNINLPKSLCVRYFVFSAFIDAFYISIVYSHLLCQFIFGGLCLLTIFMNLSVNFVNSDKSQPVKRFELLFDFLCVIGITIYLLYLIPNESLQSIMIPVISAVYGGLLTLIGVAWTIKHSEKNIRLDNKMKNKPILIMVENRSIGATCVETNKYASIRENGKDTNLGFIMKNISQMPCKVVGVNYLGKEILCSDNHLWVENQENVWINIQVDNFKYNDTIELNFDDISENKYTYLLTYDSTGQITSVKEKEI